MPKLMCPSCQTENMECCQTEVAEPAGGTYIDCWYYCEACGWTGEGEVAWHLQRMERRARRAFLLATAVAVILGVSLVVALAQLMALWVTK